MLIAGESESGKSMFATLLTERMAEKQFEFCVIDPEGDYEGLQRAVSIGRDSTSPTTEEALTLVCETGVNLVINTVALNMSERQRLFASLIGPMAELRARTGRPHWLLVDEAHQILSAGTGQPWHHLLKDLPATIFITVSPEFLAADLLRTIDVVLVFGRAALKVVATIAKALNMPAVPPDTMTLADNEIVFWSPRSGQPLSTVRIGAPRQDHKRHTGKYAVGDVGERESFYFEGRGTRSICARQISCVSWRSLRRWTTPRGDTTCGPSITLHGFDTSSKTKNLPPKQRRSKLTRALTLVKAARGSGRPYSGAMLRLVKGDRSSTRLRSRNSTGRGLDARP